MTVPVEHEPPCLTVGVLADTHVPDRVSELHPLVLPTFESAGVSHILHAGDICHPRVLETLGQLAPVTAVRGNRDWLLAHLPLEQQIELGGVQVGLMHGHGGMIRYVLDKFHFLARGYNLHRYLQLLTQTLPNAKVVIYGHTHHPELLWVKGQLLFNPGSASFGFLKYRPPTVGLLKFYSDGQIRGEFVLLEGYRAYQRTWKKVKGYTASP